MLETDHVKKNPTFNKNFFHDWTKVLKRSGRDKLIRDLTKCDFRAIAEHVARDREEKKAAKKADKAKTKAAKIEKDRLNEIYGFAIVDGYREKVANYKVEPPGLFRGRGAHPKTGTIKKRIRPEDVTINIGRGMKIPKPPAGHKWKGIIHNNAVTWLAFYNDTFGDFKYIWLAASSRFKGSSDLAKYEKARKLKDKIAHIRENYAQEMTHKNAVVRQRATAIYLIDVLALRVGNEKDKNEDADTVGCCSLRVEHLTFTDENCKVAFDFLGKDSMRYQNEVSVDANVYNNLKSFCAGKKRDEEIFDRLSTATLNDHLKSLMPGLTAKVFRTFNASITLERELKKANDLIAVSDSANEKLLHYNKFVARPSASLSSLHSAPLTACTHTVP
jgi:DNA topoisomerase-1